MRRLTKAARRGDTMIEIMFAIAVFSSVVVISFMMMNAGIASGERALELVTARSELNAQAEALRYIHSSYVAELSLPTCTSSLLDAGHKCQHYKTLWDTIVNNARNPYDPDDPTNEDNFNIEYPPSSCDKLYEDDAKILAANKAFILNTRAIDAVGQGDLGEIYFSASNDTQNEIFQPATLSARLIYTKSVSAEPEAGDDSDSALSSDPLTYRRLVRAEGIWAVAVRGEKSAAPSYYDFYIQTCWYGSGANVPTTIDTVVRLYNPEGVSL